MDGGKALTNRNDHGFPDLRRQDDLDDEWSDKYRDPRIPPGASVIALALTAVVVVLGVLVALGFYVAAGGL